jgi:hypothetical protein
MDENTTRHLEAVNRHDDAVDRRDELQLGHDSLIERHEQEFTNLRQQAKEQTSTTSKLAVQIQTLINLIPEEFNEKWIRLQIEVEGISEKLNENFVKRTEFEVMKVEHDQIKKLVYGFIITVLGCFLAGLLVILGWRKA